MLKLTSLSICLLLISIWGNAQVSMSLLVPPTGVLQKNQLWNIAVMYTGDAPIEVNVSLTLLSPVDNQPVLTATSKAFTIRKGATLLGSGDLTPIHYNYLSSAFNVDRNPNGFLPVGGWTACYTIYRNALDNNTILAEDCIPVEVSPLSPPLLNTPFDAEVIETPYPMFSWMPPTPLQLFNDLSYDMLLVEVLQGQAELQAIQQNIPIYSMGNYRSISNNYPASNKSLDTGKLYAWRIIAKNNNQFAGQSDVWTFKISKKVKVENFTPNGPSVQLKKGYESAFTICTGTIQFEYNNEANDSTIAYRIISNDDGKGSVMNSGSLKASYGQNYFSLPLQKGQHYKDGNTYMLQVFNSRNEQWNLNFLFRNNIERN